MSQWLKEWTTTPSATVAFDANSLPQWLQVIGAGTVVITNQDGTTGTLVCTGGEVFANTDGVAVALVSFTCTRVRMGRGKEPIAPPNASTSTAAALGSVLLSTAPASAAAPIAVGDNDTRLTNAATIAAIGHTFMSVAPASAATPIAVGPNDPILTRAGLAAFGDGSDGAVVFDGTAVALGITPDGSKVYTLARDIYATDITVANAATVYTAGFKVFYTGTCTNAGHIHNDGHAALADAAGAITNASGSLGVGTAGGAGKAGSGKGSDGTAHALGFPGGTGVGGAGGKGDTGAGGVAGTWAALSATLGGARQIPNLLNGVCVGSGTSGTASVTSLILGGTGGGGGGGSNADSVGGGGGGGGGVLVLAGNVLVNTGTITCTGGAGAAGTSAGSNATGGGGGGGGGVAIVICRTKSGNAPTAAGGAGGGKVGAAGVAGSAGTAGVVVQAYA
jgi:hypothetical protein